MRDWLRLLRTVRGLRWRQWAYRPLRRVQARLGAAPRNLAAVPHAGRTAALARLWAELGPVDAAAERRAREVLAGRFDFVGQQRTLGGPDWLASAVSPLWTYNLHYFDYAPELAWAYRASGEPAFARAFEALAGGWMTQTAGGRGPGWEPYALSLRVANWMRARLLFGGALDPGFVMRLDASLHAQLGFLRGRLEWHLLANHLQKNLHALVLGGLYFTGAEAARWRAQGEALLWRELFEQVLPDGGHFERSPMYHAIALGDFLEAVAALDACGAPVAPPVRERVGRMAAAWTRLSRPGGQPHLFNDAAEGIAPGAEWLGRLAELALGAAPAPPRGAWALPDTGFFGWAEGLGGDRVIVDCGPPGPRYQPGHAHCDALSLELDVAGVRAVVDSGTSGYEGDPLRGYARSTRAHSTVEIGGREQSEVWGTFRMGSMARVRALEWAPEGSAGFTLRGEATPYHDRRAAHQRVVERLGAGSWRVSDQVSGARGAELRSFIHLAPDFSPRVEGATVHACAEGCELIIETHGADRVRVTRGERAPEQGWYAPRFGTALPASVVVMEIDANDGRAFGWTLRRVA
jgi:uncharacterized heparinase superfamily protein